jgi:epidermal growth factor receptor substrate 15
MYSTILRAGVLVLVTAMLAACGGSSNGLQYQASPSGSVTTSSTSSVALSTLSVSVYTVSGSLPAANAAVTVKEALSVSAPSGVTALNAARASNLRGKLSSAPTNTDILYVTFSSATPVTLTGSPALTFTSGSLVTGDAYNIAIYQNGAWTAPFAGPSTAQNSVVSFASVTTPITIGPNNSVTFVLYSGTIVEGIVPIASPTSLAFDASTPTTMTFGVSEIEYAGAFSATLSCTENPAGQSPGSNAYVAQFSGGLTTASERPSAPGGSATFTVQSGAETGSCTATITDTNSASTTVSITVSSTALTVTGKQRN